MCLLENLMIMTLKMTSRLESRRLKRPRLSGSNELKRKNGLKKRTNK
jgi:hypothetical protein